MRLNHASGSAAEDAALLFLQNKGLLGMLPIPEIEDLSDENMQRIIAFIWSSSKSPQIPKVMLLGVYHFL